MSNESIALDWITAARELGDRWDANQARWLALFAWPAQVAEDERESETLAVCAEWQALARDARRNLKPPAGHEPALKAALAWFDAAAAYGEQWLSAMAPLNPGRIAELAARMSVDYARLQDLAAEAARIAALPATSGAPTIFQA